MEKGIFAHILPLLLLLPACNSFAQSVWNGTATTAWYTSNPSATEFTITTAEQLAGLAQLVNAGNNMRDKIIKLSADIVLNNTDGWEDWATVAPANSWTAIGTSANSFSGTFDGKEHKITGLYINSTDDYQGLFGYAAGAEINNLSVEKSYVSGNNCVGGMVGYDGTYKVMVNNLYFKGNVIYNGVVRNSYFIGNVSGKSDVGGIVGYNGVVRNSYFIGNVSGKSDVGGIVGRDGTVNNSYYNSSILAFSPNGIGKTTAEMQSKEFAAILNSNARLANSVPENHYKAWVYNKNSYPTLSAEKAKFNIADYFERGNGTSENPYAIKTKKQLEYLSALVNYGNSFEGLFVELIGDIVLNDPTLHGGYKNWGKSNDGLRQWTPIGTFSGTFNGNRHKIIGLYINSTDNNQGLFGYTYGAKISNIGVEKSYVSGNNCVGGIVGCNIYTYRTLNGPVAVDTSNISNSYFIGNVSGNDNVGGIVGSDDFLGWGNIINNSYFIGNISGTGDNIGGIASNGTVNNSYFIGNVSGTGDNVGGIIAGRDGTVNNSYYNSSILAFSPNGIGKTTAEMQSKEFAVLLNSNARFGNSVPENHYKSWIHNKNNYPTFSAEKAKFNIADYFKSGKGTELNPYMITQKKELEYLSLFVNFGKEFEGEYFKLGNDIVLNDTANWQSWETTPPKYPWTAIGTYLYYFKGSFDGNGHVISGVYINNTSRYQGLFGYNKGTIKNLGVAASYINSYINGDSWVGGLVGHNDKGTVSNSYYTGTVGGESIIGGLVGFNRGTVSNSYSKGKVSGESRVGGLVGYNYGTVSNSYSTGMVIDTNNVGGGLVGHNYNGKINNSYYDKNVSKQTDAGKGEGKTTAEMKRQETYNAWDFKNVWGIDAKINNNYPYLIIKPEP